MSELTAQQKAVRDTVHAVDSNGKILCRQHYNGICYSTDIKNCTCPECCLQIAAPQLLEACKAAHAYLDGSGLDWDNYIIPQLQAAIAAAGG